jgi:VIT1/CCC1 family predicted Fe2+/Mn2+ transporter
MSILARFAGGAAKPPDTARSWWASGIEMTLVGILEAVVTYTLGLGMGGIG